MTVRLLASVLAAALLLTAQVASADHHEPRFSRHIDPGSQVEDGYWTCQSGLRERDAPEHAWYFRWSGSGAGLIELQFDFVEVGPPLALSAIVSATDEDGPHGWAIDPNGPRPFPLSLKVKSDEVYRVVVQTSRPPGSTLALHYQIGWSDPRLDIGWVAAERRVEPRTSWAVNVDPGEDVKFELSRGGSGGPVQEEATSIDLDVLSLDGRLIARRPGITALPVVVSLPEVKEPTVVIRNAADRDFQITHLSGSDRGLYAVPCDHMPRFGPPAIPDGALLPPPAGRNVATPVVAAVGGVLALAFVAGAAWLRFGRRPVTAPVSTPESGPAAPVGEALSSLTQREQEVVALIARGFTNRRIAEDLIISESTAKRHVENILQKLGLKSRAEIAAWAARSGPGTTARP